MMMKTKETELVSETVWEAEEVEEIPLLTLFLYL